MASTYLRYTEGTSATDGKKFTFSAWIKRSKLGTDQCIFYNYINGSNFAQIYFRGSQKDIRYFDRVSGGDTCVGTTAPMLFNDVNGWYNIVLKVDTTQSASADKVQFYINGEYLAFNFDNVPSTNQVLSLSAAGTRTIGGNDSGSNNFDGLMSYVALIDGTAESANIFGETDTTTGQWKIKTTITPSVAWGNTGFWILKDGNSVTDQSGNSNNFTVSGGTLTKTEDSPSNVFSTWNSLLSYGSTMSLANGNTTGNTSSSHEGSKFLSFYTSLGMTSGKYYAEFKITSNANQSLIGISSNFGDDVLGSSSSAYNFIYKGNGWGYSGGNGKIFHTNSNTQMTYGNSLSNNDILGVALDLDNLKLYFSKNGTWQNSANPVTGSGDVVSAGAKALNGSGSTGTYFFSCADTDQAAVCNIQANFGNGYFGTTAVSSAGTNASGIGIFEFDVPTGFTSLSTKGLNL